MSSDVSSETEDAFKFRNVSINLWLLGIEQDRCPRTTLRKLTELLNYPEPRYFSLFGDRRKAKKVELFLASTTKSKSKSNPGSTSKSCFTNLTNFVDNALEGCSGNQCSNVFDINTLDYPRELLVTPLTDNGTASKKIVSPSHPVQRTTTQVQNVNPNENPEREFVFVCKIENRETLAKGSCVLEAIKFAACAMLVRILKYNFDVCSYNNKIKINPNSDSHREEGPGPFRYVNDLGFSMESCLDFSESGSVLGLTSNFTGMCDKQMEEIQSNSPLASTSTLPKDFELVSNEAKDESDGVDEGSYYGSCLESSLYSAFLRLKSETSFSSSMSMVTKEDPEPKPPPLPFVIDGKYKVVSKIFEGYFGIIMFGSDIRTGQPLALKFEREWTRHAKLHYEQHIMKMLNNSSSDRLSESPVPIIVDFVNHENNWVQVTPYIGPSIEMLFKEFGPLSINTVKRLGMQMLRCLEYIHKRGVIHRDVKPANFVIDKHNKVWIIDFGLSKPYGQADRAKIYQVVGDPRVTAGYGKPKSPTGTPRFSSPNALLALPQTCQDDLVSLGYSLVYLVNGELPWQGLKFSSYQELSKFKNHVSYLRLCESKTYKQTRTNLFLMKYFKLVYKWKPNTSFNYDELADVFRSSHRAGSSASSALHSNFSFSSGSEVCDSCPEYLFEWEK